MQISRRDLLKLAGTVVATQHFPFFARGAAANDGFAAPPLLSLKGAEPGVVEAELFAAWANVPVAGTGARLRTYNGSFPGPTLQLREGEHVRLRFTNLLDEPTNLHLHGLHLPPVVDDPFRMIEPGDSALYEFDVPRGSAGTYWYHPHIHGRVAEQLFSGLAGAIAIDPPGRRRLRGTDDHLVVLKDLTLQNGAPAPHTAFDWMNGKEGSLVLVNGALRPTLRATANPVRLRLLNASNARYYNLSLDGHPLLLVATDGGFLNRPISVERILLAPGERAEVLLVFEAPGTYRLLDLPYDRGSGMGGMHGHPSGRGPATGRDRAPTTLLTIEADSASRPFVPPRRLARLQPLDAHAGIRRQFVFGQAMMGMAFTINGQRFDEHRVDIHSRVGDVEVWEIRNPTGMDHPFHLHTYPFRVLSRNGAPEPIEAWKDVVNVAAGEVVRIVVPLLDFTGKTVFHCHIVEHEDRGMMGVLGVE